MAALDFENMIQSAELRYAYRGMEFAEPEVHADVGVLVGTPIGTQVIMSMIGEGLREAVDVHVISEDGSAFTTGNRFHIVEGETAYLPERPQRSPPKRRPGCLGRVLDECEMMSAAQLFKRVDLRHRAAHVHDQDGFRLRCNGVLNRTRIEAQGLVDFGKNGHGSREEDGLQIRDECEGGKDDFVARPYATGRQCRAECSGAAGTHMGIAGPKSG